jgi:hypothetical protein
MATYVGERIGIQPSMLTITPVFQSDDGLPYFRNENSIANLSKVRIHNRVSPKAQKKIRSAVNWLLHATRWKRVYSKKLGKVWKFKLVFVTLTTDVAYSDTSMKELKEKVLQPWLSYARQYFKMHNYIWKAERAESGMLHFHLTCDAYIPHWKIRNSWNRILAKTGFLDNYHAKHGNYNANSTDVHAVRGVQDLAAEICKYMAKSDLQGKFIEGRLWGCSYELSKAHGAKMIAYNQSRMYDVVCGLSRLMRMKDVECRDKRTGLKHRVATLFFPQPRDWLNERLGEIKQLYDSICYSIQSGHDTIPLYAYEAE